MCVCQLLFWFYWRDFLQTSIIVQNSIHGNYSIIDMASGGHLKLTAQPRIQLTDVPYNTAHSKWESQTPVASGCSTIKAYCFLENHEGIQKYFIFYNSLSGPDSIQSTIDFRSIETRNRLKFFIDVFQKLKKNRLETRKASHCPIAAEHFVRHTVWKTCEIIRTLSCAKAGNRSDGVTRNNAIITAVRLIFENKKDLTERVVGGGGELCYTLNVKSKRPVVSPSA